MGLEKIPDNGPSLLIAYHGPTPIDAAILAAHLQIRKKRKLIPVIDRVATRIPGFRWVLEAWEAETGTLESLVYLLNNNNIVLIYPGGLREMLFSSSNYELIWGNRKGFAQVAITAKVVRLSILFKF